MTDVAQLAGVSVATVSRFLNGSAQVTEDKRQAVEQAIRKLNFRPNLSAQSLRSGSSKTIGVLTQDFESPYFNVSLRGVERGLVGSGYAPLVVPGHWQAAEEAERVELLLARGIDALIVLGGSLTDAQLLAFSERLPVAVTGRRLQGPRLASFYANQILGGRMATEHLIALGHRAIAHVAGPSDHPDAIERKEGFMQAHRAAGLPVDPRLIVPGNYLESGGEAALDALMATGLAFSAVFCANDLTLWGLRLALHRRGVQVPQEVALIGFDDVPASRYMTPPVSTVRQPVLEMGQAAAEASLAMLGGQPAGEPQQFELSLTARETSGPA